MVKYSLPDFSIIINMLRKSGNIHFWKVDCNLYTVFSLDQFTIVEWCKCISLNKFI